MTLQISIIFEKGESGIVQARPEMAGFLLQVAETCSYVF